MKENYFLTWERKKGERLFRIKKNFYNEDNFAIVSKKKYRNIYNNSIREGGREEKKIETIRDFLKSLENSVIFSDFT